MPHISAIQKSPGSPFGLAIVLISLLLPLLATTTLFYGTTITTNAWTISAGIWFCSLLYLISPLNRKQWVWNRQLSIFMLTFVYLLFRVNWAADSWDVVAAAQWWLEGCLLTWMLSCLLARDSLHNYYVATLIVLGLLHVATIVLRIYCQRCGSEIWIFRPFTLDANSRSGLQLIPMFFALGLLQSTKQLYIRAICVLLIAGSVLILYVNDSRATYLGLFVGLVAWAAQSNWLGTQNIRRILSPLSVFLTITLVLIVGLFSISFWVDSAVHWLDGSSEGRVRRWANGMALALQYFPWGAGTGEWENQFENFRHSVIADPGGISFAFNWYLQLLVEGGIVLFLLVIAAIAVSLAGPTVDPVHLSAKCAVLALSVFAIFHMPFEYKSLVIHWFALLAYTQSRKPADEDSTPGLPDRKQIPVVAVILVLAATGTLYAQTLSTLANVRSAVAGVSVRHQNGETSIAIGQVARKLPHNMQAFLTDVDYYEKTPDDFDFSRYTTHGYRKILGRVGENLAASGQCDRAIDWLDAEIRRHPKNGRAWTTKCRCLLEISASADVSRPVCQTAVTTRPHDISSRLSFSESLLQSGDAAGALQQTMQADALGASQVGAHEFGRKSIGLLDQRLAQLRKVQLIQQRSRTKLSLDPPPASLLSVPEVHKTLTQTRDSIVFTSNESGRYELWSVPKSGGDATLLSNHSKDPFSPQADTHGRSVHFVSDSFGDGRYQLYNRDIRTKTSRPLSELEPDMEIGVYRLSPQENQIAFVRKDTDRDSFQILDIQTSETTTIALDFNQYSKIAWSRDSRQLAVAGDISRVAIYDLDSGQIRYLESSIFGRVLDLDFSPGGNQLAVVLRAVKNRHHVLSYDTKELSYETLPVDSIRPVTVDWISPDRLIFRVFDNDRYLLKAFTPTSNIVSHLGPEDGVVYDVIRDHTGTTLYFVHTSPDLPPSINSLNVETGSWDVLYRLSHIQPRSDISYRLEQLDLGDRSVPVHWYTPEDNAKGTVVWLHGGSSSFSPRWHKYAQYYSANGYEFAALNFSGSTGQFRSVGSYSELQSLQIEELTGLIEKISEAPIILLGVSSGTRLLRAYETQPNSRFDATIEFAPLSFLPPPTNRPKIMYVGENDPYFEGEQTHQSSDDFEYTVRIFENEGHDLRQTSNIRYRLEDSLRFLDSLPR
ncbi:MAG: O-antigen ligase family protein [Pseudomonadota bacterium]